jgi:hypothetical protein
MPIYVTYRRVRCPKCVVVFSLNEGPYSAGNERGPELPMSDLSADLRALLMAYLIQIGRILLSSTQAPQDKASGELRR